MYWRLLVDPQRQGQERRVSRRERSPRVLLQPFRDRLAMDQRYRCQARRRDLIDRGEPNDGLAAARARGRVGRRQRLAPGNYHPGAGSGRFHAVGDHRSPVSGASRSIAPMPLSVSAGRSTLGMMKCLSILCGDGARERPPGCRVPRGWPAGPRTRPALPSRGLTRSS